MMSQSVAQENLKWKQEKKEKSYKYQTEQTGEDRLF